MPPETSPLPIPGQVLNRSLLQDWSAYHGQPIASHAYGQRWLQRLWAFALFWLLRSASVKLMQGTMVS
jgi:hypothetical protein